MPTLVTIDEAAARRGLCRRSIYYRISLGKLPAVREGRCLRVYAEALDWPLNARQPGGRPPTPKTEEHHG